MLKQLNTRDREILNYNPKNTLLLFTLFILNSMFSHADVGIFGVSGLDIQKEFNIEEVEYGVMISIFYLGMIIGVMAYLFLLQKIHVRYLLFMGTLLNSILIMTFPITTNYFLLLLNRALVGFAQALIITYTPVWIDQCAVGKKQTAWSLVYFMSYPVGYCIGYGIDVAIQSDSWKLSFYIQGIVLIVTSFLFLIFPKIYYTTSFAEQFSSKLSFQDSTFKQSLVNSKHQPFVLVGKNNEKLNEIKDTDLIKKSIVRSVFQEGQLNEKEDRILIPIKTILLNVISNPTFMLGIIAITNSLFILTAFIYYSTTYTVFVLNGDASIVYGVICIIALSAPISGHFCSNFYMNTKYFGKNTIYLCLVIQTCFFLLCFASAMISNCIAFMCLLWFQIFTIVFMQPIMNRVFLSMVAPVERPAAQTLHKIFTCAFGQFLSTIYYSAINQGLRTDENGINRSKAGMKATLILSVIGVISLLLAIIFRNISKNREIKRLRQQIKGYNMNLTADKIDDVLNTENPENHKHHDGITTEGIESDQTNVGRVINEFRNDKSYSIL